MKKIILSIILLFAFQTLYAQSDSIIRVDTLKNIQIIGITNCEKQIITETKFSTREFSFLNVQKDPYFVLDRVTPSIYSQSDNGQGTGYSYLRLRGLDQTRINFNLNGIPLNEMEDQGIFFSNIPGFYNYLSNISVERGVGSSKYGNTSIAGSVNMQTKNTSDSGLELSTSFLHRYNGKFITGLYSSGDKNKLSFQLGATLQENTGFRENSGNKGGSVYYSLGYKNEKNIFRLYGISGLIYNNLSFNGVTKEDLNTNYRMNTNTLLDRDTFNQNFVSLNWIRNKDKKVSYNTTLYFNNVNGTYNVFGLYGVNSYQGGLTTNMVIHHNESNTMNIGFNTNFYKRRHFGSDSLGFYSGNATKYVNTGYKNDYIVYVKDLYQIVPKLNFFYDIQFRSVIFNTTNSKIYNWNFYNPKIGVNSKLGFNNLYLTAAITNREPTRTDMLQNIIGNNPNYTGGNPDNDIFFRDTTNIILKPENVINIELGNKYVRNNIDFSVNLYYMVINNEYVSTGVLDPAGFMIKDMVNHTVRKGVEVSLKYRVNNFLLFANTQAQHNKLYDDNGKHNNIPFAPNYISSGGVSYLHKNISTGFNTIYVSSMNMSLTDVNIKSNNYTVTNMFVECGIKNYSINFNVGNVFNNKYYIPASVIGGTPTFYAGSLLNYMLIFKVKF